MYKIEIEHNNHIIATAHFDSVGDAKKHIEKFIKNNEKILDGFIINYLNFNIVAIFDGTSWS